MAVGRGGLPQPAGAAQYMLIGSRVRRGWRERDDHKFSQKRISRNWTEDFLTIYIHLRRVTVKREGGSNYFGWCETLDFDGFNQFCKHGSGDMGKFC